MTTDPWADEADRTPLYDEDGRLLLVLTTSEHAYLGREWADGVWRPDDVPVEDAVQAALAAFPGWALSSSDPALLEGVLAAGGRTIRHAHTMTHDLDTLPDEPTPAGLTIEPVDATGLAALAEQVGPVLQAAYPPGHPDHEHDTSGAAVAATRQIAAGDVLGPLLDVSTVATHDAVVVGACLVVAREGTPPLGGPWVLDVFRDPANPVRGIGRALMVASLQRCAEAGLPGLSLAVSHANVTARRLYEALGFRYTGESRTVEVPPTAD